MDAFQPVEVLITHTNNFNQVTIYVTEGIVYVPYDYQNFISSIYSIEFSP